MNLNLTALCCFPLFASLCTAQAMREAPLSQQTDVPSGSPGIHIVSWTAPKVEEVYGLPETKPKTNGTLAIDSAGLTFASRSGQYAIPWASTIAVSDGSERVEMFGTTGTIVRAMIPDGGGLAAAAVMHHKIYDLTVEFHDGRGAYHAAVFKLAGNDAARVLDSYRQALPPAQNDPPDARVPEPTAPSCNTAADSRRGVLVAAPAWGRTDVPAAFRGLIYEHIVARLQHVAGAGNVYRADEHRPLAPCPQYTVRIAAISFRPGSQVERATMGPLGFFVGTTQMVFSVRITDASGDMDATHEFKVTMRGEAQSQNVADGIARRLAKYYAASVRQYEKSKSDGATGRSLAQKRSSM